MEADRIIGIIKKYLLGLGYNENNVKTLMLQRSQKIK